MVCVALIVELSSRYLGDELTAQVQYNSLQNARAALEKTTAHLEAAAVRIEYLLTVGERRALGEVGRGELRDVLCFGEYRPGGNHRLVCRADGAGPPLTMVELRLPSTKETAPTLRSLKDRKHLLLFSIPDAEGVTRLAVLPKKSFEGVLPGGTYSGWIVDTRGQVLVSKGDVTEQTDLSAYPPVSEFLKGKARNMQMRFQTAGLGFFGAFAAERELGLAAVLAVSEEDALRSVRLLRRRGLYLSAFLGGLAAAITFALAWGLTRPLHRLTLAAARIESGDYSTDLGRPGSDELGVLTRAFGSMVAGIQRNEALARHHALHDSLTGLPNRTMLQESLPALVATARRNGTYLCICQIELDRFRRINESLGHAAGDQVLREVAERLSAARLWNTDLVVRLGGDAFAVVAAGLSAESEAMILADRLIAAVETQIEIGETALHLSASLGLALFPADAQDWPDLVRNSEAAMSVAKSRGGARYSFYTEALNARAARRLSMEAGLHEAIERGELEVHFQPRVRLRDGLVAGVEALARWYPKGGREVPPLEFIPLAEETGLIHKIGGWILEKAISQIQGLGAAQPEQLLKLSVNISPHQLRGGNFSATIAQILTRSEFPADQLELEVTESALVADAEAREELQVLRDLGVRIAIDDFGTGYSSLAYIRDLPLDVLKIDRSFVAGMGDDARQVAIVRAILALAHGLDLLTIAEGVETVEQAKLLRQHGCHEVQGFLFFRPMPIEALQRIRLQEPVFQVRRGSGT